MIVVAAILAIPAMLTIYGIATLNKDMEGY